jgi:hypothetical protein
MFCYKYNVGDTVYCFDFSYGILRKCVVERLLDGCYFISNFSERKHELELSTCKDVLLKRLRKEYAKQLSNAQIQTTILRIQKGYIEKEMDKYGIKYPKLEE